MWALKIVFHSPASNLAPCIPWFAEPTRVQAFVTKSAVEAFDVPVLCGLSGLNVNRGIYQQTFIDTYSKVAFAKLFDRKNALVAADMLNDRVLPFFEEQDVSLLRILTDRGTNIVVSASTTSISSISLWRT
jgi:hypothetical protein